MLMELSSASNFVVNAYLFSLSIMAPKLAGLSFDELSLWYRGVCVGSLAWLAVSSLLPVCAPSFLPLDLSNPLQSILDLGNPWLHGLACHC